MARELRKYLTQITEHFEDKRMLVLERFVLCHGRDYTAQELPDEFVRMEQGQCFKNAAIMAMDDDALTYVEGFGLKPSLIPLYHAWCATADGMVIENTWEYEPGTEYIGVPIPLKTLRKIITKNGRYGAFDTGRGFNVELMREFDCAVLTHTTPEHR